MEFIKSDAGLILACVLIFMGFSSFILSKAVILPRLKKKPQSKETDKQLKLFNIARDLDMIVFVAGGAVLLYMHFR